MKIGTIRVVLLFFVFLFGGGSLVVAQEKLGILEFPQEFNKKRFITASSGGLAIYITGVSIVSKSWYSQYEKTKFHTFNDWSEWTNMDKAGHLFTAWMYSQFAFKGAQWTGMKHKNAAITSAIIGFGLQGTLEMLDAFSAKWGFSVGDIAFNTAGSLAFLGQELLWKEQRITFKMSTSFHKYSTEVIISLDGDSYSSLAQRADNLYGQTRAARFIKDYNAQTIWASVNISSFLQGDRKFPKWLNISVGYGAENMFGGFSNTWQENGSTFSLDKSDFPRYRQFFISPDIDLTRISTNKKWLKTTLKIINIFKIPSPAFEINSLGKTRFHLLYF